MFLFQLCPCLYCVLRRTHQSEQENVSFCQHRMWNKCLKSRVSLCPLQRCGEGTPEALPNQFWYSTANFGTSIHTRAALPWPKAVPDAAVPGLQVISDGAATREPPKQKMSNLPTVPCVGPEPRSCCLTYKQAECYNRMV